MKEPLLDLDRNLIWHPYSQHGLNQTILPVQSAKGAYLKLIDGREILDGISSWWVNLHGHGHPEIAEAIYKQALSLEHVIFSGFTHEPAVQLAETLTSFSALKEMGLSRVFYSDNGSTAVEVALKMAYQFHLNKGDSSRQRFLALSDSYHGDTLGAMAVGEPGGFHTQFRKLMPQVDFVRAGDLEGLKKLVELHKGGYAAFIFEPLVQGAGGMKIYRKEFLKEAIDYCRAQGILTIADEVFTGFYRTGRCFASEYVGVRPDFMCLSKGLTGGFLPLAITLCQEEIFKGFLSREMRTAFLHGHSYTANPIACAAALASWKILQSSSCQDRIRSIGKIVQERTERLHSHPKIQEARCLGTIGAVELKAGPSYFSAKPTTEYMAAALRKNVLLRPLGSVFYTVPPYCCTDEEIHLIYDTMEELVNF